MTIEPLSATDAELAGALRSLPGGRALSLADRCCLGLTVRGVPADVRAADRAWAELDLPITIRLIRSRISHWHSGRCSDSLNGSR